MENTCIKVLSLEHGKKVIDYYQSLGADIGLGLGKLEGKRTNWYYGIFNGEFNLNETPRDSKVITLPDPLSFPRWMMVSQGDKYWNKRLVLVDLGDCIYQRYVAIVEGNEDRYLKKDVDVGTYNWKQAKEIEDSPKLTELTLKEIAEKLNIPVNQLRIKE